MNVRDTEHGRYRPIGVRPPQPNDRWPYNGHPNDGHDPQYGYKSPKYERHIFIRRDQVFFDIDSQISMMNASRRKENGIEDDTLTSATEAYQQQFFRWIDKHIGLAKATMSAFVLEKSRTTRMNSISQNEEVDIELLMPDFWNDTVFDQLCQAVHDYIVNATLYEYFSITLTVKDPVTISKKEQADEAMGNVQEYCNAAKPGMIKKTHSPF